MGPLAHLFLPFVIAYAVRPDLFETRLSFVIVGLGLLPDMDKFVGVPGLFHSLVFVVPCSVILVAVGRSLERTAYGWLAAGFLWSHLILDLVDGGPVPLLFPFVRSGVGLRYPMTVAFGQGPLGVAIEGSLVELTTRTPRPGFNEYGFINGTDVTAVVMALLVYLGINQYRA